MKSPAAIGSSGVHGALRAPGGPFLYDSQHRVIFLHGVNAVYKYPPYELYPDPGKPWNFDAHDASLIARLGFDVVRLGMTWSGLEPGTASANDPAICSQGTPTDPHQFDEASLLAYLKHLKTTVDLLGRYHIYSLLDMHQDVYNELFDGEGAPDWAVCTNGLPVTRASGRWSNNYSTAAADAAYANFWTNDVAGDLQGEYDRVWTAVAAYFAHDSWVVGYDPFNEPFSISLVQHGRRTFDNQLLCFYEGTTLAQEAVPGQPAISCPPQDPAVGLIPDILRADPNHLVFYEPDIFTERGSTNFVGPMDLPRLVFNFHDYCGSRSPVTGDPIDLSACAGQESRTLLTRSQDLPALETSDQPRGPAWFMSEFGATGDSTLLWEVTAEADRRLVGWSYWAWRYYDDPTGSSDEALVGSNGRLRPSASVLSQAYPQAIAGTPKSMSFDPTSGEFRLTYTPSRTIHAPTVIYMPLEIHYANGYCATVAGGQVVSGSGSRFLYVVNGPGARTVSIDVSAGPCP